MQSSPENHGPDNPLSHMRLLGGKEIPWESPPAVEGVTPKLIADLFDFALKFGEKQPAKKLVVFNETESTPNINLLISASTREQGHQSITVSRREPGENLVGLGIIGGHNVIWDRRLTPEEALRSIEEIRKKT